jgi:hypothetical protein
VKELAELGTIPAEPGNTRSGRFSMNNLQKRSLARTDPG